MKKIILYSFTIVAIGSAVLISCKSKNNSDAITPGYKQENGTGGNVNPGVTTTGTIAVNNNPTASSSMQVGGGSWNTPGCSVGQTTYTMTNLSTSTSVVLVFGAPPTTGNYTTVSNSNPGAGQVYILVTNPLGQPTNSQWSSGSGKIVNVNVTSSPQSVNATFSNVICNQVGGNSFFTVTISGNAGCV